MNMESKVDVHRDEESGQLLINDQPARLDAILNVDREDKPVFIIPVLEADGSVKLIEFSPSHASDIDAMREIFQLSPETEKFLKQKWPDDFLKWKKHIEEGTVMQDEDRGGFKPIPPAQTPGSGGPGG